MWARVFYDQGEMLCPVKVFFYVEGEHVPHVKRAQVILTGFACFSSNKDCQHREDKPQTPGLQMRLMSTTQNFLTSKT